MKKGTLHSRRLLGRDCELFRCVHRLLLGIGWIYGSRHRDEIEAAVKKLGERAYLYDQ